LELEEKVTVTVDLDRSRILLTPATVPGVRPSFTDCMDRFIDRSEPALEALAET